MGCDILSFLMDRDLRWIAPGEKIALVFPPGEYTQEEMEQARKCMETVYPGNPVVILDHDDLVPMYREWWCAK